MKRKPWSTAVIFLAVAMASPLAQARDGHDDYRSGPIYRETHVERHYYHHRHHYYNRHHAPAPRYHGPHCQPNHYPGQHHEIAHHR